MTVPSESSKISYTGDGSTTTFPFNFKIFNKNDLLVMAGTSQQTVDVDYTVTGVGEASGGDVIFTSAPADGTGVVILRQMSLIQETEYTASGAFPSTAHETALDRLTMMVQQLDEKLSRTPQIALSEGITGLEIPAPGAGYAIGWNPSGNQLALVTAGGGAGGGGGGYYYSGGMVTGSLVDIDGALLSDNDGAIVISPGDSARWFTNEGTDQPVKAVNWPYAVYDATANKTFVAIQAGLSFDQYVTYYDHATGTWAAPVKAADGELSQDSHGNAAICLDSDGYIHLFYGSHSSELKHVKSDSVRAISAWSTAASPSANCTYPKVFPYGDSIYIFHRGSPGQPYDQYVVKSADKGASWGADTKIIEAPTSVEPTGSIYVGTPERNGNQVHLPWVYRYDHDEDGYLSLQHTYHAVYDLSDDHLYDMAGNDLGAGITEAEADGNCRVVNAGTNLSSLPTLRLDPGGYPHLIYAQGPGAAPWAFYHVYWTGSAWSTPVKIVDVDRHCHWGVAAFKFTSPTSITAYLEIGGNAAGDIEKWQWISGIGWSQIEVVLSRHFHGNPLSNPLIPLDNHDQIEVLFSEIDEHNWTNGTLQTYAYSGSEFVPMANRTMWATSGFAMYLLDADSSADENPPYVLKPARNAGDKRWILQPDAVARGQKALASQATDSSNDITLYHGDLEYQNIIADTRDNNDLSVILDVDSAEPGDMFVIRNMGKGYAVFGKYPAIKVYEGDKTAFMDSIYATAGAKAYMFDGIHWNGVWPGSGETVQGGYERRLNLALGPHALAEDSGTALGYQATAKYKGTAVGRSSRGSSYGAALGMFSDTNDNYNAVALGYATEARRQNEMAKNLTGRRGGTNEDIGSLLWESWYGETTNATPTEIFLGGTAGERFVLQAESVVGFELQIIARDNVSGDSAFYTAKGAIKRDGAGNTALLAAATPAVEHEDDASWGVSITADDTNEALAITVTGDSSNLVRWGVCGRMVEVSF